MACLLLLVTWLFALVGNVLVVLVIQRSRRVQSTTNFFVLSLAGGDLALLLLAAPVEAARVLSPRGVWLAGDSLCRLVRFVQLSCMAGSSLVLVGVCLDRFYTILYPLSFKVTRGTAKRLILGAWAAALILSAPALFFFHVESVRVSRPGREEQEPPSFVTVCPTFIPATHTPGLVYAAVCLLAHVLCPVTLLTGGYFRIFRHIHSVRTHARRCAGHNPVPRAKVKMVRMLAWLTLATLLLQLPYVLSHAAYTLAPRRRLTPDAFLAAFLLLLACAALKPVVYACSNSNFWRGVKETLCMSAMRCYRLNNYTVTSASALSRRNYVGVMDVTKEQDVDVRVSEPGVAFNRSKVMDKTAWPINGSALPSSWL
ncbi:hypothetical protein EGW08_007892 [Elysia chlorotica]|uniref:G-protein coupled receptors family 1 profile domain-containing protein n=1 Tax=Elysia chlorotica TaxID=188477 RepID=A0A433TS43_ELYCH|nr:hypothetical protein EGW08_007892 [Elysia chlorotica]